MPAVQAGDPVPAAQWQRRCGGTWRRENSRDYLQGPGGLILCALPRPLQARASTARALRYLELEGSLRTAGVTAIACLAVSEAETLAPWADALGLNGLDLIADDDASFTRAMGLGCKAADGAYDTRGYGLLVQDGRIAGFFPADTDADRLLRLLDPRARGPELYGLLTRRGCPHSARARRRLRRCGLRYEEIMVGRDISERALRALSAADETPQVFVSGTLLGDAEALEAWLREQRMGEYPRPPQAQ